MKKLFSPLARVLIGLTVTASGSAFAANCRPPCVLVEGGVRPSSVIPGPDEFSRKGEIFSNAATVLNVAGNAARQVSLGNFGFQIGRTTFNSVSVHENGFVTFGAAFAAVNAPSTNALIAAAAPTNLSDLGSLVIAPFYADLTSNPVANPNNNFIGNVTIQFGSADPYANGPDGEYSRADLQNAVRIVWYGVTTQVGGGLAAAGTTDQVFAELLLTEGFGPNREHINAFSFRYGTFDSPGQNSDGAISGFSFGDQSFQYAGPFRTGAPTYFELQDGSIITDLNVAAVPEPATWMMMLLGFAAIGVAARRRRRVALPA